MWVAALSEIGEREHFRVITFTRAGCLISTLPLWDYPADMPGYGCTEFNKWAISAIAAVHPFAIVAANRAGGDRNYHYQYLGPGDYGFAAEMDQLPRTATKVLLGPSRPFRGSLGLPRNARDSD